MASNIACTNDLFGSLYNKERVFFAVSFLTKLLSKAD